MWQAEIAQWLGEWSNELWVPGSILPAPQNGTRSGKCKSSVKCGKAVLYEDIHKKKGYKKIYIYMTYPKVDKTRMHWEEHEETKIIVKKVAEKRGRRIRRCIRRQAQEGSSKLEETACIQRSRVSRVCVEPVEPLPIAIFLIVRYSCLQTEFSKVPRLSDSLASSWISTLLFSHLVSLHVVSVFFLFAKIHRGQMHRNRKRPQ